MASAVYGIETEPLTLFILIVMHLPGFMHTATIYSN